MPPAASDPTLIRRIAPCLLAIVVDAMGFGLVYPVLALLFSGGHRSYLPGVTGSEADLLFGLAYLLYPLGMLFGSPVLGGLSDRYGRKPALLASTSGLTVAFAVMAWGVISANVWCLLGGRLLSGLAAGSQPVSQAVVSEHSSDQQRAHTMRYLTLALSVGFIAGPILGGMPLLQSENPLARFAAPLAVAAALALGSLIWLALRFPGASESAPPPHPVTRGLWHQAVHGLRSSQVRRLCLLHFLYQAGFSLYFGMIPVVMLRNYGLDRTAIGFFNGMIGLGFILSLLFFLPPLTRRYSDIGIARGALFIIAGCIAFSSLPLPAWLLWVLALGIGLANMLAFNNVLTLFSRAVSAEERGAVMGLAASAKACSWILAGLGPIALGVISPNILLLIGAGCVFLAASTPLVKRAK